MIEALDATTAELPADAPRYLMGVGDPVGVLEAIALGVDMFDCVLPTRLARHGTILTDAGRLNLRNAAFAARRRASRRGLPVRGLCSMVAGLPPALAAGAGADGRPIADAPQRPMAAGIGGPSEVSDRPGQLVRAAGRNRRCLGLSRAPG